MNYRKLHITSVILNAILVVTTIIAIVNDYTPADTILATILIINSFSMYYFEYKNKLHVKKKVREESKKLSGAIIAALEVNDLKSTIDMVGKFDQSDKASLCFQFYILGILSEKDRDNENIQISELDEIRDRLFGDKKINVVKNE